MPTGMETALLMRWVHVMTAIVVVGSILFYWIAVRPAALSALTGDQRAAFREALMKRWKMLIHPSILLFMLSGIYNYLYVTRFHHEGQGLYHMLFGIKFLLAIVTFALAIIATSTRAWSERLRGGAGIWWALMAASVAVVLIAGYMKVLPGGAESDTATAIAPIETVEDAANAGL